MTKKSGIQPLPWPLSLLDRVWFGIFLMAVLFVYCSIGSAGVPVSFAFWEPGAWYPLRESRMFEMTEYEWFNWWPFFVLVGLTCLNMAVVTIRRIPLTAINAGVWMIHGGIIVMCLGCVIYFGTKVEGDVVVARSRLHIEVPGAPPVDMRAMPGASTVVRGDDGVWSFRVASIDPTWSLLSGEDAGEEAYAVTVSVEGPTQSFMRQVIAGYPEYTEDIVASGDPSQPMARAKKTLGTPLVDETLSISMQPDRRDTFYLQAQPSLYLREVTINEFGRVQAASDWIERPIKSLPRFHDRIGALGRVWIPDNEPGIVDPLDLAVSSIDEHDPLAGTDVMLSDYLRYAVLQPRAVPAAHGEPLPWAHVSLATPDGRSQSHEVMAGDSPYSTAPRDQLGMTWVEDEAALESASPMLKITVDGQTISAPITETTAGSPDLDMTPIEGTPFAWRVQRFDNGLFIAGQTVSLAHVEISDGEKSWLRWVFNDPSLNTDMPLGGAPSHDGPRSLDERIEMVYTPPVIGSSSIELLAGPGEDDLRLRVALGAEPRLEPVTVGVPIELARGITLTVNEWAPIHRMETRPWIVPRIQRDRAMANQFSMVRAVIPGSTDQVAWLPMHHYPFESMQDAVVGFRYAPTMVELPDGRLIELMLSRRSSPLPARVSLDGFRIASHVGGFTGSVSSVLNWHSQVRFEDDAGAVEHVEVSVNDPKPREGLWFFQSQWDPPDPGGSRGGVPSAGRNFTVLGVGNRNGVWTMLAGCVLSVMGMIYAFYVKPMLKRKAALAVYAQAGGVA
ncbi:MAG: hypothetical protein QF733_05655 [Phycisphaerales bacterium]|jgi:hypothetical protein|nr:hypothetical protein [Phycisphaerales bacterium]